MKKDMKKNKGFFFGFSLGFMLFIGLIAGITLAIDTSIVNQLQQVTQTTRTNDMFNPIIVSSTSGRMKIEITLPTLNMIAPDMDDSDVFIRFGRISNPILSVFDWVDRGQYLTDLMMWGEEYDDYCDSPDATDTYYTHFYIEWDTEYTLAEDYTYVLILDFYDGDGWFFKCDELWGLIEFFGEEEGPLTIRPPKPAIENAMWLNVDPDDEEEEYVQDLLLNCDFISFFEYKELAEVVEDTTPTGTPTGVGAGDGNGGATSDGWLNGYDIFPNVKNGIVLLILILILGLLGMIIFFILFFMKKKKDEEEKKKKGKKKK